MIKYYLNQVEEEKEGKKVSYWKLCKREFEKVAKDASNEEKENAKAETKKFNELMKGKDYILLPTSLSSIVKKVLGEEEEYKLLKEEFSKLNTLISADVSFRNAKTGFTKAVKESINDRKLLEKGFTEEQIKEMKASYKADKKAVNVLKTKLPKKAKAKKEDKEETLEVPEMQ